MSSWPWNRPSLEKGWSVTKLPGVLAGPGPGLGLEQLPGAWSATCLQYQGGQSVASMVVFEEGKPTRDQYRRFFKIRTVEGRTTLPSLRRCCAAAAPGPGRAGSDEDRAAFQQGGPVFTCSRTGHYRRRQGSAVRCPASYA